MSSRNRKKTTGTTDTQVIVAIIGLIGTVGVAYFAFLGNRVQIEVPISTTQTAAALTAIAQSTIVANSPQATQTAVAFAVTTQATPMPATVAPTSTSAVSASIPTIQPSVTPQAVPTIRSTDIPPSVVSINPSADWTKIIKLKFDPIWSPDYCDMALVFPPDISPDQNPVDAKNAFNQAIKTGEATRWQRAPVSSQGSMMLKLTSVVEGRDWIRIGNTVSADVSVRTNLPDHLNIIQDCAGAGDIREFPSISLDASYAKYTARTTYKDADFFTLQPGEFEIFKFFFRCHSPGIYIANLEIPYAFTESNGNIEFTPPTLICPKSFTVWSTLMSDSELVSRGTYVWKDNNYIESP